MTTIELTPRLRAVANLVEEGAKFADIGTDHAFLPTYLLQIGRISSAIAADIRSGPLSRAQQTGERYEMGDRIQYRLCDGLLGIQPDEVDCVAIAGMGGETIVHILTQSQWALRKTLILQPMATQPELREFLQASGCAIAREITVREGELLYTIMLVKPAEQPPLTVAERLAGRQWQGMDDPLRGELLAHLQGKLSHAMETLSAAGSVRAQARYDELKSLRDAVAELERAWNSWQQ